MKRNTVLAFAIMIWILFIAILLMSRNCVYRWRPYLECLKMSTANQTTQKFQNQDIEKPYTNIGRDGENDDEPDTSEYYQDDKDDYNDESSHTLEKFTQVLSTKMRREFTTLIRKFDRLMTNANLTYFLIAGSLLGAYRFRDMIPWDDDVDVAIMFNQINSIQKAVDNAQDGSRLAWGDHGLSLKFYNDAMGKPVHSYGQRGFEDYERRYPDLDLFLYRENSTHVWDLEVQSMRKHNFRKSSIFPLKRLNFGAVKVQVPKDVRRTLSKVYDMRYCVSNHLDHNTGDLLDPVSVQCEMLAKIYKFYNSE